MSKTCWQVPYLGGWSGRLHRCFHWRWDTWAAAARGLMLMGDFLCCWYESRMDGSFVPALFLRWPFLWLHIVHILRCVAKMSVFFCALGVSKKSYMPTLSKWVISVPTSFLDGETLTFLAENPDPCGLHPHPWQRSSPPVQTKIWVKSLLFLLKYRSSLLWLVVFREKKNIFEGDTRRYHASIQVF